MTLMALAIIPGVLILIYIYVKDKVEKEPIRLILITIALGALSCIPAGIAETYLDKIYPQFPEDSLKYALLMSFCEAALCEEIVKYLALRIPTWNNPEFNYRFDGIVYGVASAIGFATLENILYVFSYGFGAAIIRACTAVPLHAFCGVFMGIFYAYSKKAEIVERKQIQLICTFLSLLVPMIIHGIYDTLAFWQAPYATILFLTFVVIIYIISLLQVRKLAILDEYGSFYPCTPRSEMTVLKHNGTELIATLTAPPLVYCYNNIVNNNIKEIAINYSRGLQKVSKEQLLGRFTTLESFINYFSDETNMQWGMIVEESGKRFIVQGKTDNYIKIKKIDTPKNLESETPYA